MKDLRMKGSGFRVQDATVCPPDIRPGGAEEEALRCMKNAEEHFQTCSAYGVLVRSTRESFAPPGRELATLGPERVAGRASR